ncbi:MAG: hypothetical protein AVDCRST_MAG57-1946, partial [uncultured Blastococcus sp.]
DRPARRPLRVAHAAAVRTPPRHRAGPEPRRRVDRAEDLTDFGGGNEVRKLELLAAVRASVSGGARGRGAPSGAL